MSAAISPGAAQFEGASPVDKPLVPEVGVVFMAPEPWSALGSSRFHVAHWMSHIFRVVWVNPARPWRDVVWGRDHRLLSGTAGLCPPPSPVMVYEPQPWLPLFHRPRWLANLTFDLRVRRARRLLRDAGCTTIALHVCRPALARAPRSARFAATLYHIDDEYSFSEREVPVGEDERRLIESVDQVIVHSPGLMAKKGHVNRRTAMIPNGVNYAAYAAPRPEPEDLAPIPHPRIGYTGLLKQQLDWTLIETLVNRRPGWSFVFVGPVGKHEGITERVAALGRRANVHLLGVKSVDDLPSYVQHFDVCLLPYRVTPYTSYIYPLKLHEYLASGKPVVGSRIQSLEPMAGVIELAETVDGWEVAIARSLETGARSLERVTTRRAVAQLHDWRYLVARLALLLADRLGEPVASRVREGLADPKSVTGGRVP
ncbi:MAG: glycosyltransferase [Luteitalea sp.]|nr:glycosyltransferase [Luteitalea sp.]